MKRFLHYLFGHWWEYQHSKGAYDYYICKVCEMRKCEAIRGLIGPEDKEWLNGGKGRWVDPQARVWK